MHFTPTFSSWLNQVELWFAKIAPKQPACLPGIAGFFVDSTCSVLDLTQLKLLYPNANACIKTAGASVWWQMLSFAGVPMPMHSLLCCATVGFGLIAGCAVPEASRPTGAPVTVKLNATSYNAGEIGQATLLPQSEGTRIVLQFSGVPYHVTLPVHVYTYLYKASCGNLPSHPAYSLNQQVLAMPEGRTGYGASGPFSLKHMVAVHADALLNGGYAIAMRTAPADGNQLIYCGDLRS